VPNADFIRRSRGANWRTPRRNYKHWASLHSSPKKPLEHTQKAREIDLQAFDLKLGDAHEVSYQEFGIGTSAFVVRYRDVRLRASDIWQRQTIRTEICGKDVRRQSLMNVKQRFVENFTDNLAVALELSEQATGRNRRYERS
jgi:hypothetical protein